MFRNTVIESYPIKKTKQFAITAAVGNSTLLCRSHQPCDKGNNNDQQ